LNVTHRGVFILNFHIDCKTGKWYPAGAVAGIENEICKKKGVSEGNP
jgi:hypothetical protein